MVLLGKLLDKLLVLVHPLERFNIHVIKIDLLSLQTNEYTSMTSSEQKQKKTLHRRQFLKVQRFMILFQTSRFQQEVKKIGLIAQ